MSPVDGKPRPERAETDASLGAEREKTDAALAEARSRTDEDADLVLEKARDRADAVLSESRRRADTETAGRGGAAKKAQQEAEQQARTEEDQTIESERSIADRALLGEREEREAALREFLLSERDLTDTHLTLERARADFFVAGRDDFLGMVSHDLRNLLGGIALQAVLLKREAPADERGAKLQKRADAVGRLTARMNRLVGDLLDIASIEAGRLAIVPTQHDAVQLARDTTTAFEPAFAAAGITFSSQLPAEPLVANFDFDRVLQVLANLMGNALKFTSAAGIVEIKLQGTSDAIHFTVTDSGPGIPDSLASRIFERFVQAPENTRRGLGLGLYISRCIVESHGGKIWLERSSPSGSAFCFTLPTAVLSTPS
jgi:signal transduction histidine kinase